MVAQAGAATSAVRCAPIVLVHQSRVPEALQDRPARLNVVVRIRHVWVLVVGPEADPVRELRPLVDVLRHALFALRVKRGDAVRLDLLLVVRARAAFLSPAQLAGRAYPSRRAWARGSRASSCIGESGLCRHVKARDGCLDGRCCRRPFENVNCRSAGRSSTLRLKMSRSSRKRGSGLQFRKLHACVYRSEHCQPPGLHGCIRAGDNRYPCSFVSNNEMYARTGSGAQEKDAHPRLSRDERARPRLTPVPAVSGGHFMGRNHAPAPANGGHPSGSTSAAPIARVRPEAREGSSRPCSLPPHTNRGLANGARRRYSSPSSPFISNETATPLACQSAGLVRRGIHLPHRLLRPRRSGSTAPARNPRDADDGSRIANSPRHAVAPCADGVPRRFHQPAQPPCRRGGQSARRRNL